MSGWSLSPDRARDRIDGVFLAALLTVNDSVNDSVVVFDRIRELGRRDRKMPFARTANHGYALLDGQAEPDPDSGLYKRHVFFLLPHDRDSLPGGLYREGAPGEAVDPRTIEVKKVGEKTPRPQSGPAAITGSRS